MQQNISYIYYSILSSSSKPVEKNAIKSLLEKREHHA